MSGLKTIAPCLLALALLSTGCGNQAANRLYFLDSVTEESRPPTFAGMALKTGQIVVCEGPGAYSFLFSLGTKTYSNFTHAGVIIMEEGVPYVYEMTGEYKPGFDERPTDGIVGGARRLKFLDYCTAYLYVEVYDPPEGADGEKIGAWVKEQFKKDTPFDAYFDYDEHEKLFCTEFVQLAIEAGGGKPKTLQKIRKHPSLGRLISWFQLEPDHCLPAGMFVDPPRYRAALGMLPSRTAAYCYFAAKAEVHRRFTDDQLLGNLFSMDGFSDVALRPELSKFMSLAVRLFPVSARLYPLEEIQARVSKLAEEVFGVQE